MNTQPKYLSSIVGLFIAFILPFAFSLCLRVAHYQFTDTSRYVLSMVRLWSVTLLLLAVILLWERQSLSSIGIRKTTWNDVLWGFVGFLLGALVFGITTPVIKALHLTGTESGILQLGKLPILFRLAIVLTAGITEEIIFRGYVIERLNILTGRIGWGAAIGYFVFVVLHLPFWGWGGTIQIGLWSLVVTILYVKRRNLPACMLMHVLNDAYAFLLLPNLLANYVK
jgi:membrane protease YdiL (CAAX protease family)